MRLLRLVPDNTKIRFMRGRFAGVITSAVLSIASIILFIHPGLNYTIDFRGGVLTELRFAADVDDAKLRSAFGELGMGDALVQPFGSPRDQLVRLTTGASAETIRPQVQAVLDKYFPGTEILRLEVVGAKVSNDLTTAGLEATGFALLGILAWIWFRFDWQFGVGLVVTLVLDATKTIGFYAVTQLPFDQDALAAVLILIGFSVTDKVVVYDRIRENLRKFKAMPLREVIDLSINQTLSRTVATSLTVLLSIVPLAIIARGSVQFFAITMVFGIFVGTMSSIFIASPILLFLGEKRLRRGDGAPSGAATAQ
ncbi:MAG TPA: protein translocase subunit SecF [Aliidongia sp.]|nr:protein translocase subunit SecF [Aliidongia sp.]